LNKRDIWLIVTEKRNDDDKEERQRRESHTRYVMLAKVNGKDTKTVINALIKQSKKLPQEFYKSLTWDRRKELSDHKRFSLVTDIDVYFCDPQSPWQRGSSKNSNGLLR
jgi:IS30 family transposase